MGSCQSGNTEKSDFKLDTARVVAMPFDRDAAPSRFGFKSKLPAPPPPPKAAAKEVVSANEPAPKSASKPAASANSRFGFRPVRPAPSEQAVGNGSASEKAPLKETPPPLEAAKMNGNGSCKLPYGNKLTIYRSDASIAASKESLSSKENQRKPSRPIPKAQKPSSHSSTPATTEPSPPVGEQPAPTGAPPRTTPAIVPRFNAQRKVTDSGGKYDLSKVKDELRLKVVPSAARPKSPLARLEPEPSSPPECNAASEANDARQPPSDASSNASDSAYCSQPCSVCEERTDKAEENSDMMRSTESSATNAVTQSDLMHVDASLCTDSTEQLLRQRILFDQLHSLFLMNSKDHGQSQIVQFDDLVIMQSETYRDLVEELRSMKRLMSELGQALQNTNAVWLPPTSVERSDAATQTNKYETLIPSQSNGPGETQIVSFVIRKIP